MADLEVVRREINTYLGGSNVTDTTMYERKFNECAARLLELGYTDLLLSSYKRIFDEEAGRDRYGVDTKS
jgi:hypothetical protein